MLFRSALVLAFSAPSMFALLVSLHALLCFLPLSVAFSFTVSTLSECDDFTLEWTGGTGPYSLLISPPFGTQRIINIPTSAFNNGRGSFTMQLPFAKDQQMVLTMSDSTAFGAGGTSQVLSVGESRGGSCNTTDPGVDFPFQLNFALQQCRPFTFEGYGSAVQPVTVSVVVPGGKVLSIPVPRGDLQFSWPAAIPAGTNAMFMMSDARGGLGGVSDIIKVGASDERGCLNENALSSTFVPSSSTSTQPSASSAAPAESQTGSSAPAVSAAASSGVPISAIASTVIGSLLFLAVIVTLGLFFLKNWQKKQNKAKEMNNSNPFDHGSNPYGSRSGGSLGPSSAHLQNPFSDSSANVAMGPYPSSDDPFQSRPYYPPSPRTPSSHATDPFNPSGPPVLPPLSNVDEPTSSTDRSTSLRTTSTGQQKAAMAGVSSYKPTRFVVHEDAEDAIPPNADGVVELPPMYSERRAPSNFVLHNPDQQGQIPNNASQDPHTFPPRS